MNFVILIPGIIFVWIPFIATADNFKRVEKLTAHGTVSGFQINSHYAQLKNRKINIFLGIPYAKRPSQFNNWKTEFRFRVSIMYKPLRTIQIYIQLVIQYSLP